MTANDSQIAGNHYKSNYQHWDWCLEALQNRYLEGQVTKYVARWRKKNGLQDLEKALHFLQKLKESAQLKTVLPITTSRLRPAQCYVDACVDNFVRANTLTTDEAQVMELMANWRTWSGLDLTRAAIERLMEEAKAAEPGAAYVHQG